MLLKSDCAANEGPPQGHATVVFGSIVPFKHQSIYSIRDIFRLVKMGSIQTLEHLQVAQGSTTV